MSRLSRAVSDALGGSSRRGSFSDEGRYVSRESRLYEPRGRSTPYNDASYPSPVDDYYYGEHESPRSRRSRATDYYYSPETTPGRHRARSRALSPGPTLSKTPDISESSRNSRRQKSTHVIEDSRPPVTSRIIPPLVYHIDPYTPPSPRRASSTSSRKSRSKDSPERESRFSRLLRRSSSRNESTEKLSHPERRSRSEKPRGLVECVICTDEVSSSKGSDLKCGHRMCNSCLKRIFRLSVTDPQHMPPRCCTKDDIPLKCVDQLFDHSFKKNWNAKYDEFTSRNRLYCPARGCGQWIKPDNIRKEGSRKVGRCGRCKTRVCAKCGEVMHTSSKCPKDESTKQFLNQAAEEGWKRCYKCKAMVELREGCNHMTCRCGAEFCMVCGVKWKGCDCPWFNNHAAAADQLNHMNIPGRDTGGAGYYPTHAQTYGDEMRLRRLQELRDSVVARELQNNDYASGPYDMSGGLGGGVASFGNASGHLMNESYRRPAYLSSYPSPPRATRDRPARYPEPALEPEISRGISDPYSSRYRRGSPPAPPLRPRQIFSSDRADIPLPRGAYRDEPRYDVGLTRTRSERVVPARAPRRYEEESKIYAPRHQRHSSDLMAKSSAMAGLNGKERGSGRVAEWATFVEPGVPEGESVVGHA